MKIKLIILSVFLFFFKNLNAQCSGYIISTFPDTLNGVTVTQTYTGDVNSVFVPYTYCNITACPTDIGQTSSFSQTLSFSSPVNDIVYVLNASGSSSTGAESFTFIVNTGTLTATQIGGCPYTQTGNTFVANVQDPNTNGAYITLHSTTSYTSINVSGPGGYGGSCMALCSALSTGIENYKNKVEVSLYPTPANNILNITNNSQLTNNGLQLYDVLGNIVKTQTLKSANEVIDVSNLPNGVYYVQVQTSTNTYTQKVLVQH